MKKLIVILLAFAGLIAQAKVYYVAPKGGSDKYAGTDINYPWATWQKAFDNAFAGDTVYFLGGIYYNMTTVYHDPDNSQGHNGTRDNPICFFAYPDDFNAGNYPILDGIKKTIPSGGLNIQHVKNAIYKGLTIRNNLQIGRDYSYCSNVYLHECNNVTIQNCVSYNTGMRAFYAWCCDTISFIDCDAYNAADTFSVGYSGGAGDGFLIWDMGTSAHKNARCVLRRCRAWNNSDDGYDIEQEGYIELDSCWAINNGYLDGDGTGFKIGLHDTWIPHVTRRLTNCLAAYNSFAGFTTNDRTSLSQHMQIYNNISYRNEDAGFIIHKTLSPDSQDCHRVFINNISYGNINSNIRSGIACYTHSNNSWDANPAIKITDDFFISVDTTGLTAARNLEWSFPKLDILKLSKGCELIDAGKNIGIPFYGSAPDIGYYESNYDSIILVTKITVTVAGNDPSINIDNGTLQLNKTVLPANATNQSVTWSIIAGAAYATISSSGLVTAVNNGTITVQAMARDGSGISGTININISNQKKLVTDISVSGAGGSTAITTNGGTLQLTATVMPSDASNKNVIWSLVNESGEATISASGLVTAVANGTVIARASATDGSGISQVFTINITNQLVPVSAISVKGTGGASIITDLGGILQLIATTIPENATNKTVIWSIENNTGQAVINSSGLVTALASGIVIARATSNDGTGVSGTLTITISEALIPVSDIAVTGENTMQSGEYSLQLNASVSPVNATDRTITWSVLSGTGQATISSTGLVTALANGSVTAIATANDGSGVSESFGIVIGSFPVTTVETKKIFIDPGNQGDPLQDGTPDHPFESWSRVSWKEGYSYLQKKGTLSYESKINITAGNVTLGSYGEGEQPVIHSSVNDFAVRAYEKTNIFIRDLHIIAVNAISCIYILGEACDNICIEYCTLESSVNGARILDGKNMVLRYNTFINCSEGIYCYADNSTIYYNVFRDNEVAISAMASMANAQIYNNVFYNNTIGISNTYTDLTLYNNIFYLVNSSDKAIFNNQLNQLISDHNIFYPEQTGFIQIGSKIYSSLREYQHDLGLDLNSITDDPAFVDAYNQNFSVASGSPAINAGKLLGLEHDFYGTRVPSGGLPDIGLAELSSITASINHLNDPVSDDFQVYPNPCQGVFNVYVRTNNAKDSRITIRDLSGKMVYENLYSNDLDFRQEIDISSLHKGIYIVAVEDDGRSLSQPVIIR